MCINHTGHHQIKKLVVSAAINQVLQNLLDRLMRVSITYPNYSYPHRGRGPLAAISIELVVAAARSATTHPSPSPPVAAFSTHLAIAKLLWDLVRWDLVEEFHLVHQWHVHLRKQSCRRDHDPPVMSLPRLGNHFRSHTTPTSPPPPHVYHASPCPPAPLPGLAGTASSSPS
jgi:hypothetical protein